LEKFDVFKNISKEVCDVYTIVPSEKKGAYLDGRAHAFLEPIVPHGPK
jgi:hypothetical protein